MYKSFASRNTKACKNTNTWKLTTCARSTKFCSNAPLIFQIDLEIANSPGITTSRLTSRSTTSGDCQFPRNYTNYTNQELHKSRFRLHIVPRKRLGREKQTSRIVCCLATLGSNNKICVVSSDIPTEKRFNFRWV